MTLSVRGPQYGEVWTRLEPPTPEHPAWHEEDGTEHAFLTVLIGLSADTVGEVNRLHVEGIASVAAAAIAAHHQGDHREARRLSTAAGRLCDEIAGLWPVALRQSRNGAQR